MMDGSTNDNSIKQANGYIVSYPPTATVLEPSSRETIIDIDTTFCQNSYSCRWMEKYKCYVQYDVGDSHVYKT